MRSLVNPFSFPSELSFYFALMLINFLAPAVSLAFLFTGLIINSTYQEPFFPYTLTVFPLFTLILLPTLTVIFYNRRIKSKIEKYGKNKIEEKYTEISNLIDRLCHMMGIKAPISLYTNNEEIDALAFGFRKQAYLLVSSGLCEKFKTLPDLVETILIHELSHLKNRDITSHEIAESLWRSFATVGFVNSILGLVFFYSNYDWIISWLKLVSLTYLFPLATIFYLNNVIQRFRELYADIRTISIQENDKNLITYLRLFCPSLKSNLAIKLFSPFILTPYKRIKILQEDIFRRVVERVTLCSIFTILSLFASLFSLTFLSGILQTFPQLYGRQLYVYIGVPWILSIYLLFTVVLMPYWTYTSKEAEDTKRFLIKMFTTPLRVSLFLMIPTILLSLIIFSSTINLEVEFLLTQAGLQLLFFILIYFLLIFHRNMFHVSLSFASLKADKIKIFFISWLLFLACIILAIFFFMNLIERIYAFSLSVMFLSILGSVYLFLFKRYSKCPYCNKKIEAQSIFQCPSCLHRLNEEFLILIDSVI